MSTKNYCPICGELNDCAMVESDSEKKRDVQESQTCWCFQKTGTLNRQKLAEIYDGNAKRCLCQKCWEKFAE